MPFPLGFFDISIWLTVTAIILLITSEVLATYQGKVSILVNRKRLRNTALAVSILFLATAAIRIISIFLIP